MAKKNKKAPALPAPDPITLDKQTRNVSPPRDPRGAKCDLCQRHMLEADGCNKTFFTGGKLRGRVDRQPYPGGWGPNGRCHDCGCKIGHYHHMGCDVERCPVCHNQMLSCQCLKGADEHVCPPDGPVAVPAGPPSIPAYEPKAILMVAREGKGYLVALECGHTVWCAIEQNRGDKMHCGVCLDELVQEIRKTQVTGRERL